MDFFGGLNLDSYLKWQLGHVRGSLNDATASNISFMKWCVTCLELHLPALQTGQTMFREESLPFI